MLSAVLNKSWKQHPTKNKLYDHLPPILQTIQERRTKHVRHCWRSKDLLVSDLLLWTSAHGHTIIIHLAKAHIHMFCADTGCNLDNQPRSITGSDRWCEWVKGTLVINTIWRCLLLLLYNWFKQLSHALILPIILQFYNRYIYIYIYIYSHYQNYQAVRFVWQVTMSVQYIVVFISFKLDHKYLKFLREVKRNGSTSCHSIPNRFKKYNGGDLSFKLILWSGWSSTIGYDALKSKGEANQPS